MSVKRSAARMLAAPQAWDRRRLQVFLAVAVVVVAAVLAGLAWATFQLMSAEDASTRSTDAARRGETFEFASEPLQSARPGPLARVQVASIVVPQPTRLGEAQVGSGFPRTAEGALGQLIAINQRAIESADVVTAQDVISRWAAPGGPTPTSWSGVAAVRELLQEAELPVGDSAGLILRLDPVMGTVGTAGTVTLACVDFVLSASLPQAQPIRVAVADCQHMVWKVSRWMIAPGAEAPPMPSVWPGTAASYEAGYLWLEIQP